MCVMQPVWTTTGLTLWAGSEIATLHRCGDVRTACSWVNTAAGAGLPNVPANAVVIDPSNSARIFIGTDVGMFASGNAGLPLCQPSFHPSRPRHAFGCGDHRFGNYWPINISISRGPVQTPPHERTAKS